VQTKTERLSPSWQYLGSGDGLQMPMYALSAAASTRTVHILRGDDNDDASAFASHESEGADEGEVDDGNCPIGTSLTAHR
jgi:hypothetical protein